MFKYLLASLLIVEIYGQNCGWPNGTDTGLHWWADSSEFCQVYYAQATDTNGNPEYPINIKNPVIALLNVTNKGAAVTHAQLDINLQEYGGWTGCVWSNVPTFGLLNGLNACEFTTCPVPSGNQLLKLSIDFSKFSAIINLLNDKLPYELDIKLTNLDTQVSVSAHVQTKIIT